MRRSIGSELETKITEVDREKAKAAMTDELYATERAYKLVTQGMSFRDAYREIAKAYVKK